MIQNPETMAVSPAVLDIMRRYVRAMKVRIGPGVRSAVRPAKPSKYVPHQGLRETQRRRRVAGL